MISFRKSLQQYLCEVKTLSPEDTREGLPLVKAVRACYNTKPLHLTFQVLAVILNEFFFILRVIYFKFAIYLKGRVRESRRVREIDRKDLFVHSLNGHGSQGWVASQGYTTSSLELLLGVSHKCQDPSS